MRIQLAIVLPLFVLLFSSSCKKKKTPIFEDLLITRILGIHFTDSSSNPLIGKEENQFSPDSVQIYTTTNNVREPLGSAVLDSKDLYSCNFMYFQIMAFAETDILGAVFEVPVYIYLANGITDTIVMSKSTVETISVVYKNKIIEQIPALNKTTPYFITIEK